MKISGELFQKSVINGALNLKAHVKIVNDLNVFPIPDGDTGENMYMTISGGVEYMKVEKKTSISAKSRALADGMLLSARGNSGVILSQLFNGLAEGLAGKRDSSVKDLMSAFKSGVKRAYGSVVKPVEGTILTVAREATENTPFSEDIIDFMSQFLDNMHQSLEHTPELLATLKEAGVIDSGGAGLLYITEGMRDSFAGQELEDEGDLNSANKTVDFSAFTEDSVMTYGYCTEFLLRLQKSKVDIDNFDTKKVIQFLETLGDSIVVYVTGSVLKVHVHTLTPGKVLDYCQKFGEYLTVKIENMTLQHNETEKSAPVSKFDIKKTRPHKKFGLVTVAQGEGIKEVFTELGADVIIDGGQTKNPSIEAFLEAFEEVNSDEIFVLPNNSNVIMAAKQASTMFKKSKVWVVETKNIGDAYSVLSMLDYTSDDGKTIVENMRSDIGDCMTCMVTKSVRTATLNGVTTQMGEYMGLTDDELLVSTPNKTDTVISLLNSASAKDKNFIILIYGRDVNEGEKAIVRNHVATTYPHVELYEVEGKQELYDFYIILE